MIAIIKQVYEDLSKHTVSIHTGNLSCSWSYHFIIALGFEGTSNFYYEMAPKDQIPHLWYITLFFIASITSPVGPHTQFTKEVKK